MATPRADRPHLPGYGTAAGSAGLLPWSWAETRLRASHDFWLATVRPDRRPHPMPVWAVWTGEVLWFSSSRRSVKARNVAAGSAVSIATDDPYEPVVVEGTAEIVTDAEALRSFLDVMNAKYATDYEEDFLDPGTPTRWRFA